jgi:hypothetical protein
MRTVFFILVLTNALFFAWSRWSSAAGESQLLNQQLRPEAIRLLKPEQVASAAKRPELGKVSACLEMGAFSPGDVARVEQLLQPLSPKLEQRRVDELAGYWVFMPPQPSRQVASQKIAELKRLGIDDFFVVQDDPRFRLAISLGVFRSEDAAKVRLEEVRVKGVRSAQLAPRETQVQKVFFVVRDVPEVLGVRLNEVRQGFPGVELRECGTAEKPARLPNAAPASPRPDERRVEDRFAEPEAG